jgi:RNA polymerase sigma-70 factor (ECF subfamily)
MPAGHDPDAELMLRVKRGDREAFTALVEKYKQPVINLVARIIRDPDEAEDVAQNVFLQVHKSAARYKVSAKFTTWLFTIARNLCLNEIRRRARHQTEPMDAASPHAGDDQPVRQFEDVKSFSPDDAFLQGELAQKVEEALAALPENQRTAILLYQRQEMSYEEIAGVLDCSLASVKSVIHRGRETLKERLKLYLRTGDWKEEQ